MQISMIFWVKKGVILERNKVILQKNNIFLQIICVNIKNIVPLWVKEINNGIYYEKRTYLNPRAAEISNC